MKRNIGKTVYEAVHYAFFKKSAEKFLFFICSPYYKMRDIVAFYKIYDPRNNVMRLKAKNGGA
jgi:hypothetical protein